LTCLFCVVILQTCNVNCITTYYKIVVLNTKKPQMLQHLRFRILSTVNYEDKIMFKDKMLKIQCQISIENIQLYHLKKFDINTSAVNDEVNIELPCQFKYYSIRDLMTILNISTIKEVKYLIKNLELEQSKYRSLNSHKKWVYNNNALNILKLYLKYKAA
jgi:hypothetical protein